MAQNYFNRFLGASVEDPEDEYERRLLAEDEEMNPAELVRRWRNPGMTLAEAPRDTRMPTSGIGASLAMANTRNENADTQKMTAGEMGSPLATAQRIDMARRWGTEDPDEDRLAPASLEPPPSQSGQKPPGPDSPSTEYKDPASKYMSDAGYDARKKAYDEDWDASGKYKKFRIETTQQRAARREMQQRDLYLAKQKGVEAYNRAEAAKPRVTGTVVRMAGAEGDGMYERWTDGTYKKVGGVLDKEHDEYEPGVVVTGDRWLNRMKHDSTNLEPVMGPYAMSDANPFLGGAGPLAPDTRVQQRKWVEPKNDPDEFVNMPEGSSRWGLQPDGTYKKVIDASPKTFAPKSEGGARTPKDPEAAKRKEAAALGKLVLAEAHKIVDNDPAYRNATNQEVKDEMFKEAQKLARERIVRSRGDGVAAGKDEELTELEY